MNLALLPDAALKRREAVETQGEAREEARGDSNYAVYSQERLISSEELFSIYVHLLLAFFCIRCGFLLLLQPRKLLIVLSLWWLHTTFDFGVIFLGSWIVIDLEDQE